MRISVAMPFTASSEEHVKALASSLTKHGFTDFVPLYAGDPKTRPSALITPGAPGAPGVMWRRPPISISPSLVLEAALRVAPGDWVFILYPGEHLEGDGTTLLAEMERCQRDQYIVELQTEVGYEARGFRKRHLGNGPPLRLPGIRLLSAGQQIPPTPTKPPWAPRIPITVVLPTWRIGGLDITLGALARQTFRDFEVIVVDALHEWRSGLVAGERVHHVSVDNSIFPISSHSRFRNTAIRRAQGARLVFLSDYASPHPDFLAAHAHLPDNIIGLTTWARTKINPDAIDCPLLLSPSEVVELARNGKHLMSTFKPNKNPFGDVMARYPDALDVFRRLCTMEYAAHWKSDSVGTALVRHINGWDESFDGRGDYADVDFNLRLLWAGAEMQLLPGEVPVLDAHDISVAPLTDYTRNNFLRLEEVREHRAIRCAFGLDRAILDD